MCTFAAGNGRGKCCGKSAEWKKMCIFVGRKIAAVCAMRQTIMHKAFSDAENIGCLTYCGGKNNSME